MKKINNLHCLLNSTQLLSERHMSAIKGGNKPNDAPNDLKEVERRVLGVVADDKRRNRPGGGNTTH